MYNKFSVVENKPILSKQAVGRTINEIDERIEDIKINKKLFKYNKCNGCLI